MPFIDNVPVEKAIADSVSDNSKAKTTLGKFIPKISSRKKPKLPNEIPESNELETSKATLEVKEKKIKKKRMMSKKDKLELELQEMRKRIKELEESRGGALFSEDSYSDGSSYGSMEENDAGCFIPGIMVKSVDSRDNPGETGFDCGITSVF